jgi:predicted nuclease with TOPRIM domain
MQKAIDRCESRTNEMQRKIDALISTQEIQRERSERLNNELTDLTDLHQTEISTIKTDLKNLEDRLLYKLNDYWSELLEKLDKLDTRVRTYICNIIDKSRLSIYLKFLDSTSIN